VALAVKLQLSPFEKLPASLVENLTVPVGVILPVLLASLTVAVQVVEPFTATEEGVQLTLVAVVCAGAVIVLVSRWKRLPQGK
jgi:hypothetical protein